MFSVISYELLYGETGGDAEYEYTEGAHIIEIPKDVTADIAIVGAGGGVNSKSSGTPQFLRLGGSGAAFVGRVKLIAGEYTAYAGEYRSLDGTSSSFMGPKGALITAGAGKASSSTTEGTLDLFENRLTIISSQISSDGNAGYVYAGTTIVPPTLPYTGGASLYKGYGMGAQYDSSGVKDGTGGYFYLKY